MREILFKAKRIDNGEWEIGSLVALPNGDYEIANKCQNPPDSDPMWKKCVITHKVDPSTICQYTGLTDKNGQKIWENDVIRGYLDDSYPEDATYAEVIFWKSGFYTREKGSNDVHKIDYYTEQNYEIVGNIFDNPELLSE